MQPVLYAIYKNDKNSKVGFWLCFSSIYYIILKEKKYMSKCLKNNKQFILKYKNILIGLKYILVTGYKVVVIVNFF